MRRGRFDVLELVSATVFAFLLGVTLAPQPASTRGVNGLHPDDERLEEELEQRFGPHYSNGPEEWIVRDVFADRRGGVFVDVGAYKWQEGSNTYRLEADLGWSGVAIDAVPDYADDWRRHRPKSRFVTAFVDEVSGQPRTLFLGDDAQRGSVSKAFVTLFHDPVTREVKGTSATLDSILGANGIDRPFDLLSLDIELGEPAALRGFDIHRYWPTLVCVEAHPPVRQQILEYFARAGYVLLGKYQHVDPVNYYFVPLSARPQSTTSTS